MNDLLDFLIHIFLSVLALPTFFDESYVGDTCTMYCHPYIGLGTPRGFTSLPTGGGV